jgi:hypothetical protein
MYKLYFGELDYVSYFQQKNITYKIDVKQNF